METQSLTSDLFVSLLSLSSTCFVIVAMAGISIRRPALTLVLFFVFFAFAWRLCSVFYIDAFGPLFSEQLERSIGPGAAALPLALAQSLVIAALLVSFRPSRVEAVFAKARRVQESQESGGRVELSDAAFWAVCLFISLLYLELLANGPIPLFARMERFDYSRQFGGPLHRLLLDWGPMLAFQLGVFLVVPTCRRHPADRRFGVLFAALILYLFLVGHRFSSLYAYGSFFIIPVGIAVLGRRRSGGRLRFPGRASLAMAAGLVLFGCMIAGAIAYSYMVVRGFEGAELVSKVSERILVQQGEMWWMTYERVFLQDNWNTAHAAYKLFIDPFDPNRNSTMQFLMEQGLPLARAHFILSAGSAYTGGWPEVVFELGGPAGGFALVAVSAIVFSEFMFLLTRCLVEERLATCFFLTPVLYALLLFMVSGMANSFIQLTFVLKVVTASLVYVTEARWRSEMFQDARPAMWPRP
jgi:hypothetical protein